MTGYLFITFILGTAIGSFLNLCALRMPQRKKIVNDRSACPECGHVLGVPDLIPVLSYLGLRGRCRYCRKRISFRYPLVELFTGGLFAAVFSVYGLQPVTIVYLFMASILLIAALIDLDHMYIPNELVVFGLISGTVINPLFGTGSLTGLALGFIAGAFPLAGVYLVSRGGMGAGDVKLGGVLGVFLGWQLTLVALFLSFLSGAAAGIMLMVSGQKSRKDAISFGPFLALGGIAASLWGWPVIEWYIGLMLP